MITAITAHCQCDGCEDDMVIVMPPGQAITEETMQEEVYATADAGETYIKPGDDQRTYAVSIHYGMMFCETCSEMIVSARPQNEHELKNIFKL